MHITKDKKGHIKVSLTLTFKVKCQGQANGFNFFETLDLEKVRIDTEILSVLYKQPEIRKVMVVVVVACFLDSSSRQHRGVAAAAAATAAAAAAGAGAAAVSRAPAMNDNKEQLWCIRQVYTSIRQVYPTPTTCTVFPIHKIISFH